MNTPIQTPFTVTVYTDQAAALLAGLDHYGSKTITVTPSTLTERQRKTLVLLNFRINSSATGCPIAGNELIEDLLDKAADVLEAKRTKAEAEDAACIDREIKRILSSPLTEGVSTDARTGALTVKRMDDALVKLDGNPPRVVLKWRETYGFWNTPVCGDSSRSTAIRQAVLSDPDVAAKIVQAEQCANLLSETLEQAQALRKIRMAERAAEADRIADEAKARRKTQLAAFVSEQMSPLQQRRFEAGLMADAEIIEGIEAQVFAPLADWAEFDCIRKADVIAYTNEALGLDLDPDSAITIGQRQVSALTDDEFEQLEGIRAMLPDAKVELVQHYGYMDQFTAGDDPELTVNVARIEVVVGDVIVTREYALT